MPDLTRRGFLVGAAAVGLAGCQTSPPPYAPVAAAPGRFPPEFAALYGPVPNERFPVPAIDPSQMDPAFFRQLIPYPSREPGTIVIDPGSHYLYSVRTGGMAMRYGVGVGREGFAWSGRATIGSKQEWPDWYPPQEMIKRQPEILPALSQLPSGIGMRGGLDNPLGARAMYLYQGNRDTLFRIHGTNEPWTIGKSVSSGCIRLINQDVIDLYAQTPVGTRVVVLAPGAVVG